jgi:hypothetical protein
LKKSPPEQSVVPNQVQNPQKQDSRHSKRGEEGHEGVLQQPQVAFRTPRNLDEVVSETLQRETKLEADVVRSTERPIGLEDAPSGPEPLDVLPKVLPEAHRANRVTTLYFAPSDALGG